MLESDRYPSAEHVNSASIGVVVGVVVTVVVAVVVGVVSWSSHSSPPKSARQRQTKLSGWAGWMSAGAPVAW